MTLLAEHPVEQAKADLERLLSLRSRIGELERARVDDVVLHTDPALAMLLPGGGLQPGGVYSVQESTSLAMALLAGPSSVGAWCAVVGMPGFGVEAAARLGIDLGRLVLVPNPADRWFSVTAALTDAVGVVVTAPASRVGEAEAARLAARLRQRGTVLIVCGDWPRADARLRVAASRWTGVGAGNGYLAERELTVAVQSRSGTRERRAALVLSPAGALRPESRPALRAVGLRGEEPRGEEPRGEEPRAEEPRAVDETPEPGETVAAGQPRAVGVPRAVGESWRV